MVCFSALFAEGLFLLGCFPAASDLFLQIEYIAIGVLTSSLMGFKKGRSILAN